MFAVVVTVFHTNENYQTNAKIASPENLKQGGILTPKPPPAAPTLRSTLQYRSRSGKKDKSDPAAVCLNNHATSARYMECGNISGLSR